MRTGAFSILGNRNFVLLWCAYFISVIGDHLSEMAILRTQNALGEGVDTTPMTARMTFLFMLPFFVFGPLMGYFADRFSRRRLMLLADLARMALMIAFVPLIAWCTPLSSSWGPFLPLAALGVFAAMFSPARSALLPTLITTDELIPANALLRGVGVLATTISVVLGGWLADHYPLFAFKLDAATFALSAMLVFFIAAPPASSYAKRRQTGILDDLGGGVRYVLTHGRVRQIFAVGTVFWFSAAAIRNVIPAIVKVAYQRTAYTDISMFLVLMVVGMVSGALILAGLKNSLRSEIAVTWSLIGAGLCTMVLAASVMLPLDPQVAHGIGGVAITGLGMCGSALIASYNTLLQRIVPDRCRGRVYGVLDVCVIGGLLTASGLLGIPRWNNLDRWAGVIVLVVALLLLGTGVASLYVRIIARDKPFVHTFVVNLNEFLCRLWYRLERVGPCTVPRTGPVIVTANHTCTADPLMLSAACRHRTLSFLIAEEYANIPVARWFVRLIDCIPVRRDGHDSAGTRAALGRLRKGDALAIFIEGRIPEPGQPVEPKDGVAMLAIRTGAVVVPVYVEGNKHCTSIAGGFFARHRTTIRFGKPVDLSEFARRSSRRELAAATAKIFRAIQELAPDCSPEAQTKPSRDRKGANGHA